MGQQTIRPRPFDRPDPGRATLWPRSEDEPRTSPFRLNLGRQLVEGAFIVAGGTIVFEAALFYRLWAQFTASVPASAPLSWVYGLTGVLVKPFYRFDTVTPVTRNSTFEFPALIAVEAYLLIGVILVVLLLMSAGLTGALPLPRIDWKGEVAGVRGAFGRATSRLRGGLAGANRIVEEGGVTLHRWRSRERWRTSLLAATGRAAVDWGELRTLAAARLDRELLSASSGAGEVGVLLETGLERAVREGRDAGRRLAGRLWGAGRSSAARALAVSHRLERTGVEYLKEIDAFLAAVQHTAERRSEPRRRTMVLSPYARLLTRRQFIQKIRSARQA